MKNKKLLGFLAGSALVANMALFGLAAAETNNSDQQLTETAVYFKVAPATENFTSVSSSTSALTSDKDFAGGVAIAGAENLSAGLEVTVTNSPLYRTDAYGVSFANTSMAWQTDNDGTITAAGTQTGIVCNNLDDVTAYTSLTDTSGGDGSVTDVTDSLKLVDETSTGDVVFDCTLLPQMRLSIPAGQKAGTYRTTTTFSIADA